MKTNNGTGRGLAVAVGVYLLGKFLLNTVLGGFAVMDLLVAAALFLFMLLGLRYTNFAAAGVLALVALAHLPANISNIGSNWIYLAEGIVDIGCAALLCLHKDVREHFTNEWSEIGK